MTAPQRRRAGRRLLPATGPEAVWPRRAHLAARVAVAAVGFLLLFGFILQRWSPATFLRLVDLYRSLPAAVVLAALVSGVAYFALDSLRMVLVTWLRPSARVRRALLLALLGGWLVITVAATVAVLWRPASLVFGTTV